MSTVLMISFLSLGVESGGHVQQLPLVVGAQAALDKSRVGADMMVAQLGRNGIFSSLHEPRTRKS